MLDGLLRQVPGRRDSRVEGAILNAFLPESCLMLDVPAVACLKTGLTAEEQRAHCCKPVLTALEILQLIANSSHGIATILVVSDHETPYGRPSCATSASDTKQT